MINRLHANFKPVIFNSKVHELRASLQRANRKKFISKNIALRASTIYHIPRIPGELSIEKQNSLSRAANASATEDLAVNSSEARARIAHTAHTFVWYIPDVELVPAPSVFLSLSFFPLSSYLVSSEWSSDKDCNDQWRAAGVCVRRCFRRSTKKAKVQRGARLRAWICVCKYVTERADETKGEPASCTGLCNRRMGVYVCVCCLYVRADGYPCAHIRTRMQHVSPEWDFSRWSELCGSGNLPPVEN